MQKMTISRVYFLSLSFTVWASVFSCTLHAADSTPAAKATAHEPINEQTRPDLFRDQPPDRPLSANNAQPSSLLGTSEQAITKNASTGFWLSLLLRTILVLGGVVALAYLVLSKGLPKLMRLQGIGKNHLVKVEDKILLDAKHAVYVLSHQSHVMIVATSEQQTQLLLQYRKDNLAQADNTANKTDAAGASFQTVMNEQMNRFGST